MQCPGGIPLAIHKSLQELPTYRRRGSHHEVGSNSQRPHWPLRWALHLAYDTVVSLIQAYLVLSCPRLQSYLYNIRCHGRKWASWNWNQSYFHRIYIFEPYTVELLYPIPLSVFNYHVSGVDDRRSNSRVSIRADTDQTSYTSLLHRSYISNLPIPLTG